MALVDWILAANSAKCSGVHRGVGGGARRADMCAVRAYDGEGCGGVKSIVLKALKHLLDNASPDGMENDWIVNFFDKARIVSDDGMQERWAKLLATESQQFRFVLLRKLSTCLADIDAGDAKGFASLGNYV